MIEKYETVAGIIAQRDQLRAQLDDWMIANGPGGWIDGLRDDAGRWRWLREQGGWPDTEAAMMGATPEDFDRMVDARK